MTEESQQVRSFITQRTESFWLPVTKSHNTIRSKQTEREGGEGGGRKAMLPHMLSLSWDSPATACREAKITHVVGTLSASADWLTITEDTAEILFCLTVSLSFSPCLLPAACTIRHRLTTCQGTQTRLFVAIFGARARIPHNIGILCPSWRHTFPLLHLFHFLFTAVQYDWQTDAASSPSPLCKCKL